MKARQRILSTTLALFASVLAFAGEPAPANPMRQSRSSFDVPPAVTRSKGNAVWQLWYQNYGTRSEGVHGALLIDGEEYLPAPGKKNVTTELGTFAWHGSAEARSRAWDRSGWLPADPADPVEYVLHDHDSDLTFFVNMLRERPDYSLNDAAVMWKQWSFSFKREEPFGDGLSLEIEAHGSYGALRLGGKWLSGKRIGETVDTPIGAFEWRGDFAMKEGARGWIASDDATDSLAWQIRFSDPDPEMIRSLLRLGADVDRGDPDGITALMWAAGFRDRLPEERGADDSHPPASIIETLLAAGADPRAADNEGQTALMWAAVMADNPNVTAALLRAGADVDARDGQGMTALMHCAAGAATPLTATLLLEAGADVNAVNGLNGLTPLLYAARYNGDPSMAAALIAAGADICAPSRKGETPFRTASHYNANPEVAETIAAVYGEQSPCDEPEAPPNVAGEIYRRTLETPDGEALKKRAAIPWEYVDESDWMEDPDRVHVKTPVVAWPPRIMFRRGDAEWHCWESQPSTRKKWVHGKLFARNIEILPAIPGRQSSASPGTATEERIFASSIGTMVWHGRYDPKDVHQKISGWFGREEVILHRPAESDTFLDASRYTGRRPDASLRADNAMWFFWRAEGEDEARGGYGALCLHGKWRLGGEIGEVIEFLGENMIWNGAPESESDRDWRGWLPKDGKLLLERLG